MFVKNKKKKKNAKRHDSNDRKQHRIVVRIVREINDRCHGIFLPLSAGWQLVDKSNDGRGSFTIITAIATVL